MKENTATSPPGEIHSVENHIFQEKIDSLLRDSEEFRLEKMSKHRSREFMSLSVTLASIVLGAGGFAWYLLIMGNIWMALLCMIVAAAPHFFMSGWVRQPIREYKKEYKGKFMGRLADALGGFRFSPNKGISKKVLGRTAIVPSHELYKPEDCFYGNYKGAKVTISEARLTSKRKKGQYAFDGIFVLIELGSKMFEGHSVITADAELAKRLASKLKVLPPTNSPFARNFTIMSTLPEKATTLQDDRLLKELSETVNLFDKAQLSAAFFAEKYIFVMIPYDHDMFEASDLYVPITTSDTALRSKQEIEQILSIIDIIDIYQGNAPIKPDLKAETPKEQILQDFAQAEEPHIEKAPVAPPQPAEAPVVAAPPTQEPAAAEEPHPEAAPKSPPEE